MSTTVLELQTEHGYVLLTLGLSWALKGFLIAQVAAARKKYDVPYPDLYAQPDHKHAYEFNCIQRAHQNTLETLAAFQVLLVVNGAFQPIVTSVFGVLWLIPRFMYGYGYAKHGPRGRLLGVYLSLLGIYPLIGQVCYNGLRTLGLF